MGLFDRFRRAAPPEVPRGTRESLVPIVKDAVFVARSESLAGRRFCKRALVADLWVLYAPHGSGAVYYLGDEDVALLGILPEDLPALAAENLRLRLPPVQRHGMVGAERLTCGGRFESSLLLFDDLWESLSEEISGDVVACVPAGDGVLLTGTAVPGGVERLRIAAGRILAETADPISSTLLLWTGEKWEPLP